MEEEKIYKFSVMQFIYNHWVHIITIETEKETSHADAMITLEALIEKIYKSDTFFTIIENKGIIINRKNGPIVINLI